MHRLMRNRAVGPPAAALIFLLVGCGPSSVASEADDTRYQIEKVPHPGFAEGRAVITIPERGTYYECPPLVVGRPTPHITDPCLIEGDAGTTRYGDFSMLAPSSTCGDGRLVTDGGRIAIGYVGEPLLPGDGSADAAAIRAECPITDS